MAGKGKNRKVTQIRKGGAKKKKSEKVTKF